MRCLPASSRGVSPAAAAWRWVATAAACATRWWITAAAGAARRRVAAAAVAARRWVVFWWWVVVVSAAALPQQQAHAWETVKENFKPLKKGRKPEELAPEVAPLGPACTAPPGAEEERRCVLSGVFF